jgi:hypothetical protein
MLSAPTRARGVAVANPSDVIFLAMTRIVRGVIGRFVVGSRTTAHVVLERNSWNAAMLYRT